jgi:hypothetical protein
MNIDIRMKLSVLGPYDSSDSATLQILRGKHLSCGDSRHFCAEGTGVSCLGSAGNRAPKCAGHI